MVAGFFNSYMAQNIPIHVYFDGKVIPHEGNLETVEALLLALLQAGHFGDAKIDEIFVFEEDSDDELPKHTKLHPGLKRLHVHRCRHVEVTFLHVDERATEKFRPAATIRKLTHWAKERFKVDKNQKYELRLGKDTEALPADAHIGSYVKHGDCSITLYFAPARRIEG